MNVKYTKSSGKVIDLLFLEVFLSEKGGFGVRFSYSQRRYEVWQVKMGENDQIWCEKRLAYSEKPIDVIEYYNDYVNLALEDGKERDLDTR